MWLLSINGLAYHRSSEHTEQGRAKREEELNTMVLFKDLEYACPSPECFCRFSKKKSWLEHQKKMPEGCRLIVNYPKVCDMCGKRFSIERESRPAPKDASCMLCVDSRQEKERLES